MLSTVTNWFSSSRNSPQQSSYVTPAIVSTIVIVSAAALLHRHKATIISLAVCSSLALLTSTGVRSGLRDAAELVKGLSVATSLFSAFRSTSNPFADASRPESIDISRQPQAAPAAPQPPKQEAQSFPFAPPVLQMNAFSNKTDVSAGVEEDVEMYTANTDVSAVEADVDIYTDSPQLPVTQEPVTQEWVDKFLNEQIRENQPNIQATSKPIDLISTFEVLYQEIKPARLQEPDIKPAAPLIRSRL